MARTYKASFYLVTPEDLCGDHYIEHAIKTAFPDDIIHQFHMESSNRYEWDDGLPENMINCDLSDLESRFDHDQSFANVKVGGLYRHFKGHVVKVLAVSRGTEYGEWNVVYEHMQNHTVWHRPVSMFCSEVDHDKYPDVQQKMRFELVE